MEGINEGEKSDKIKKEKDVAGGEHTSEGLWERESSDLWLLLSGRVLQSACALIPSYNDQTSNSLIYVLQCHPWISNADMHST